MTARHTSPLLTLCADIAEQVVVKHDGTVRTLVDPAQRLPSAYARACASSEVGFGEQFDRDGLGVWHALAG